MNILVEVALTNALMATGLGLLAMIVGGVCRRPALSHCLWILVLLKLITPPLMRLPASPAVSPLPAGGVRPEPASHDWPARVTARPIGPILGHSRRSAEVVEGFEGRGPRPWSIRFATLSGVVHTLSRGVWTPWILTVWLSGSLVWFAAAGIRIRRFGRFLRGATPAPAGLQSCARDLAGRLGVMPCPEVLVVPLPVSPLLWGVGSGTRVVLPADLLRSLDPEEQEGLLSHELAHLRRKDNWIRLLELTATGLFWWHPLVWWARREIGRAEEYCCDSWVVSLRPEAALAYAKALLKTVEFLSDVRPIAAPATSGAGRLPILRSRVAMILGEPRCHDLSRPARVAAVLTGLLFLPVGPGRLAAQEGESSSDGASSRSADEPGRPRTPGGEAVGPGKEATFHVAARQEWSLPSPEIRRLSLRTRGSHFRSRIRLSTAAEGAGAITITKEAWGASEADARSMLDEMHVERRRDAEVWILEASWPRTPRPRREGRGSPHRGSDKVDLVTFEIHLPRSVRLDLDRFDLTGVDLSGQDLRDVKLSGLLLIGATLSDVELSDADLSGADLTGSNLEGARLARANLTRSNLTGVLLKKTILTGIRSQGLDLTGAKLAEIALGDFDLKDVDLTGARLVGLDLSKARLAGVTLIGADLSGVDLSGKDLSGANLTGATLTRANLANANLTGASLVGAKLAGADLTGAILKDAELIGAQGLGVGQVPAPE